jgi:hypothetical protein
MNEWIFRQPVLYGQLYKHNICLLQQRKHLQKLWETSIFAGIFQIVFQVYMQSTSEFIVHQTSAANILTTNSDISLFCRLLWMEILDL